MPSTLVRFASSGGHELAARLDRPAGPARAYALFAHCFTCSKDSKAAAFIAQALAARGIAVLRFDFTGLGMSGGDFADSSFSSNIEDLLSAAGYLREQHRAPEILIGHSLGGAAVLAAAGQLDEVRAVATIAAPFEPKHVEHLLKGGKDEIVAKGEAEVDIGGRPFRVKRDFIQDLERHDPAKAIGGMRKALLVLHSPRDTIVPIDNASKIFIAARHPKSFVSLDDADHLLTRRPDAAYVAEVLSAWASRYLEEEAQEGSEAPEGVRVIEAGEGRFAQDVMAGRHRLRADEPVSVGGSDTGASPYELLLAALGACTAMTVRMYAELKKLPLERVSVELKHEKVHAKDCVDCDTRDAKLDHVDRVVTFEGPLDEAQRARLLEIANKCPVHRTLERGVEIATRQSGPSAQT
jgi:putative redox protein